MVLSKIGPMLRHPRHSLKMLLGVGAGGAEVSSRAAHAFGRRDELESFQRSFAKNLAECAWEPHEQYSVFTQYDQSFYLEHEQEFIRKYKCFYAVSKTVAPRRIVELGTHAGASADAYISAAPGAAYFGFDQFEEGVMRGAVHEVERQPCKPLEVARKLFEARGFKDYELTKADLRALDRLPVKADFAVVDAAHDFENEYADLKLALTADPTFIFVDDIDHLTGTKPAVEKFLAEDVKGRVSFFCGIEYYGGGLVI